MIQVVLVGRTIDDISTTPIENSDWEHCMGMLLAILLTP
jgi:hypothetical protein